MDLTGFENRTPSPARSHYHIQVLERAMQILEQVVSADGAVLINILAKSLQLHPSTTYRIVRALVDLGMLELDSMGRVIPGMKLIMLSKTAAQSDVLSVKAAPSLRQLAETMGEIVNLGILRHNVVMYLDKFEAHEQEAGLTVRVGQSAPLYCSALGKIFLAGMSEIQRLGAIQAQTFEAHTSHTLTDSTALEAEIARVQQQGWAEDREEFVVGIICIGAPIVADEKTLAAISITMPATRATPRQEERLREALVGTAREISHTLSALSLTRPGATR